MEYESLRQQHFQTTATKLGFVVSKPPRQSNQPPPWPKVTARITPCPAMFGPRPDTWRQKARPARTGGISYSPDPKVSWRPSRLAQGFGSGGTANKDFPPTSGADQSGASPGSAKPPGRTHSATRCPGLRLRNHKKPFFLVPQRNPFRSHPNKTIQLVFPSQQLKL